MPFFSVLTLFIQLFHYLDDNMSLLLNTTLALSAPVVFGDERDAILAKWNQIQAFWGHGRGYYKKDGANVVFRTNNHYCRFKVLQTDIPYEFVGI